MANTQLPGFRPARTSGGSGTIVYRRTRALTNNTNEIAYHDAVKADSNGNCLGLGTSSTHATAISGVACGVEYTATTGLRVSAKRLPAATLYTSSGVNPANATYVYVTDDNHNIDFIASADGALTLTAGPQLNYEIVLGAAVNDVSVQEIKASTAADTATLPIRITDWVFGPHTDPDAADCHVYCKVNAGMLEPALTTTGL